MNIDHCPICSNHCPKDNLGCGRGKTYFNQADNKEIVYKEESNDINELVLMDLRKCGHILHHNRQLDSKQLLANLSKKELETLHELLSKIDSSMNQ